VDTSALVTNQSFLSRTICAYQAPSLVTSEQMTFVSILQFDTRGRLDNATVHSG
jgi:hypothetical protein